MLTQIAVAFGILVGLGVIWFGLQIAVRRVFPSLAPHGEDPFRARFGCGGCAEGSCDPDDHAATC